MQTAIMFPGQGSQELGMGRDVAERSSEAMKVWKRAEQISGLPLREVYWESQDEALMADTAHLQPALTVVNMTLWQEVSQFVQPTAVAGHSLGEYSALVAASVLSLDTALELVSIRGKLMAAADPDGIGSMAAVLKLSRESVEEVVQEARKITELPLLIANYNTPVQYVISGHREALEVAQDLIKERKGRAISLPVSGAFHSPLMNKAAAELGRALDRVTWNRARLPVYCNVTAKPVIEGVGLHELVRKQMISSVYWTDTILNQHTAGIRCFVEVGPKGTLSRMLPAILGDALEGVTLASVSSVESLENLRETLV